MPIPIQPIGGFFPQAENGEILNDTSLEKIPFQWLSVSEKIKSSYLENLGDQVHSIYFRGSIPRGHSVDGISDVDVFALLHDFEGRWEMAKWQPDLEKELQNEFSFVKDVEVMLSAFAKDFYQKNLRLAMIIKTQSLCIYGNDLNDSLPSFFPNKEMILNLTWLEEDVHTFLQKEKITKDDCKEITKVIIRSGFEMVMEKEGKFTTDLYWCYHVFSKHFPEKEEAMKEMLHLFLNPTEDRLYLEKVVGELGTWMILAADLR